MEFENIGPDVVRVTLHGRLDARSIDDIETRFTAALAAGDKHALVDLGDVGFAASMALRMLISNARVLLRRGHRLVIFGARGSVAEMLEHSGLDGLIDLAGTEAEAIAVIAGR